MPAPNWAHPSVEVHQVYAGPSGDIGVYIAYYRDQNAERKLVSSRHSAAGEPGRGMNAIARGSAGVTADGGKELRLSSVNILAPEPRPGEQRSHIVAWQLYWIDGRFVRSDAAAKLASAWSRLRGRGDDGAALVLYADRAGFEEAANALRTFVPTNIGALDELLQRTRDAR